MKNLDKVKTAPVNEEIRFHVKVILAGDGAVGKSSLLRRYVLDDFSEEHKMTKGMDTYSKLTRVPGLGVVKIHTWDLAGQPQWSAVRESFYLGSHAMALVFDVSQPETIQHLPDWVRECRGKAPNIPVLVVASKIDLPFKVPVAKIARWAQDSGYDYIETSAKNKYNVEAMFEKLGTMGVNFTLKSR
ncbi:MAG: GTP-binding protein [Desulfobacteraceae bacterium]|nr:MAG: GTP-binding protein [Desulfobacteraceae bacterium]